MDHKKLIVIAGPTAVGKTDVSIQLARHFKTDVISADSRQFFRELEIGTAKPTLQEMGGIKHHFINSHSIHEAIDAGTYGRQATDLIYKEFEEKDYLIMCGGSGLYIKAVLEGFDDMPEVDDKLRLELIEEFKANGIGVLQEKLKRIDPEFYQQVDTQNPHRLIRALELNLASGKTVTELRKRTKVEHPFKVIKIGLDTDREVLYQRIDLRMDKMIEAGLFEEANHFFDLRHLNALQTVGYNEIFDYMEGKYDKVESIRLLKRNSRRYAKRQLTWFKRDHEIKWFKPNQLNEIIAFIQS